MNDEINKIALDLVEKLMSLDAGIDSLEAKALRAVSEMIENYEKKYDQRT